MVAEPVYGLRPPLHVLLCARVREAGGPTLGRSLRPQHPRELYDDSLHRLAVSDDDAANLADALEFIAGDLVLHELSQISDRFMRNLVDSLSKLTTFFQQGGFHIGVPLAATGS